MTKKAKKTKKRAATRKKRPSSNKKTASSRRKSAPKKAKKTKAAPPENRDGEEWSLVDRLQLADLIGVHPDTVSDYTRSGMPVITRGGSGKRSVYDAVECLAWWRKRQGQDAKEAAQTRAYDSRAELNEIQIAIKKGELIPRDDVLLAGQNYTKAIAAKVRALPRQMTQLGVIQPNDENSVGRLLTALLTEISGWKSMDDVAT